MTDLATCTITAFAKINLTLDVFGRRGDGYHSLASVVQAISLTDTIRIERRDSTDIELKCEGHYALGVPEDESNLVYRATRAALNASRRSVPTLPGLNILVTKRIPSQAGLGGGSSDAAAALVAVNALLSLELDPRTLHDLGASLGSDVPYFLHGGTMVVRGRGETVASLPDVSTLWLVIVKPQENVPTGWAYSQLDAIPDRKSHRGTKRMESIVQAGDISRLIACQCNDFELPVFACFPNLAWLHDELLMAGALAAHLCGSGSALYGIAATEAEAQRIASLLKTRYPDVTVARTLSAHESRPYPRLDAH